MEQTEMHANDLCFTSPKLGVGKFTFMGRLYLSEFNEYIS